MNKSLSLKKETPEEYKARKELQAQRTVKKETPQEYAARIDYIKKKEEVELQVETQRLFNKAEKQRLNHQNYLAREEEKNIRWLESEEIRVKNEEWQNSEEGRAQQARIDYGNTPEGKASRKAYHIYQKEMAKSNREARYREASYRSSGGGGCGGSRVYEPRIGGGPSNVEGN